MPKVPHYNSIYFLSYAKKIWKLQLYKDILDKGPCSPPYLFGILRSHIGKKGLVRDIKKPFLQISINESHQNYLRLMCRSSHRRCSIKKGILKNFPEILRKTSITQCLFIIVAGRRPVTLLKKGLWHSCYIPVNFAKFLRTPSLKNVRASEYGLIKM